MRAPTINRVKRIPARPTGWSLIELLGVISIIAILSLALAPVLLKQISEANSKAESKMLERLAQGLQMAVLRHHRIPGTNDFAQVIAHELGLDEAAVLYNRAGQQRVYLVHPEMHIGPNGDSSLPYTQNWQGSVQPANARVLLISSLSAELPDTIKSGSAPSAEAFDAIWDTAENAVPSGWTGWTGSGANLRIHRINLGLLFVQVVLNNNSPNAGRFAVDDETGLHSLADVQLPWERCYLQNTRLRLYGSDSVLQTTEILQDPRSFFYENGIWRGKFGLSVNRRLSGADLQEAYDLFTSSPENQNGKATKDEVKSALTNFMVLYIQWAESGFPGSLRNDVKQAALDIDNVLEKYLFKAANEPPKN